MADIFLSYASEDRDRIKPIVDGLEQAGWTVFWDRKTPVGMTWEDFIEEKLLQARCVVVVWSEISVDKRWVKTEARNGIKRHCLIPLQIDPVEPPFGFDHVQVADLSGWSGDSENHEWQALVLAAERLVPRPEQEAQLPPEATKPPVADKAIGGSKQPEVKAATPGIDSKHRQATPQQPPAAPPDEQVTEKPEPSPTPKPGNALWVAGIGALLLVIAAGSFFNSNSTAPQPTPAPSPAVITPILSPSAEVNTSGINTPAITKSDSSARTKQQPVSTPSLPLPDLLPITAGCFTMGSNSGDSDEKPPHQVCHQEDLFIGKQEVTFEQYDRFAAATKRELPADQGWGRGSRPVINVSWHDASAFTEWLSKQTGTPCRLPSEAEWEYAARAGTTAKYALPAPKGSDEIKGKGLANCDGCGSQWDNQKTAPVGSFPANDWGLHDMHGNVWEWVQDNWYDNYHGAPDDGSPWEASQGGDDKARVLRGSSWLSGPVSARSADRGGGLPDDRYFIVGFRVLCSGPFDR